MSIAGQALASMSGLGSWRIFPPDIEPLSPYYCQSHPIPRNKDRRSFYLLAEIMAALSDRIGYGLCVRQLGICDANAERYMRPDPY
jgi:hypothetical protein